MREAFLNQCGQCVIVDLNEFKLDYLQNLTSVCEKNEYLILTLLLNYAIVAGIKAHFSNWLFYTRRN